MSAVFEEEYFSKNKLEVQPQLGVTQSKCFPNPLNSYWVCRMRGTGEGRYLSKNNQKCRMEFLYLLTIHIADPTDILLYMHLRNVM